MARLLLLCGSLRAASRNRALLIALERLAPPGFTTERLPLGELPLFNPDAEADAPPAVRALWAAVERADALVVSSPEYAHGVTGTIKNALDWLVGLPAFVDKPVAVLNASPRASHADAALRETLTTMSARIVEQASPTLPVVGYLPADAHALLADEALRARLEAVLAALARALG